MGFLPTDDNLLKKGFSFPSRCFLCLENFEDTTHLFIKCRFIDAIWRAISYLFGKRIMTSGLLTELVLEAMQHRFSLQVTVLWC